MALSSYPATMSAIPRDAGPTLNRHGVNSRYGKFARVYHGEAVAPGRQMCTVFTPQSRQYRDLSCPCDTSGHDLVTAGTCAMLFSNLLN